MHTKLFIYCAVIASLFIGVSNTAEAKPKHHKHHYHRHHHHHDDHHYSHRTRSLYFIERNRPVKRVVYINPGGGYYRVIGGRRVVVRERYYTSYPSRYYYPDGRRRIGIRFSF